MRSGITSSILRSSSLVILALLISSMPNNLIASGLVNNVGIIEVPQVSDTPLLTANDDHAVTDQNTPVTIDVLENDNHIGLGQPAVTSVTSPANGSATINADNTVTYMPNKDFFGSDSFIYTVSDETRLISDSATVFITVNRVNNPPVAADDSAQTEVNTPVTIDVLANDSDPDGNTILLDSFDATSEFNGIITRDDNATPQDQSDDKLVYTPPADAFGTDTFGYTISDGNGGFDSATVTVTVTETTS